VQFIVTETNGQTFGCTTFVVVVDSTPPVISVCPTNRSVGAGSDCLAVVPDLTGELVATDACSQVSVTQNPLPDTAVGVGDQLITLTASDAVSNLSTCTLLLTVTSPPGAETNLSVSEFMAKNTVGITDEDGGHSDWIEIYNAGACPVNLEGWCLTDEGTNLAKWRFPATNLVGGQYLIVWASDKDRRDAGAPLHANFKLSDEGEYLALVRPDGVTIATEFSPAFPPQTPDVSYGLPANGETNSYLAWATPGMANSPGLDTNAPVITWYMTNVVVVADTNCQGLVPDLTGTNYILVVDDMGWVTVTQSVAAGAVVGLGTNEVVLGAVDAVGNVAYCTSYVVVVDQTAPDITWYTTNVVVSAGSDCQGVMPDLTGTNNILAADHCGSVTVTQSVAAGALLGLGSHEVLLEAADAVGNTAYGTNFVTVVDQTPPVITWYLSNLVVSAGNDCQGVMPDLTGTNCLVGVDNCGSMTVTQSVAAGTVLGLGTNEVILGAVDTAGNAAYCTSYVAVVDQAAPVISLCPTNRSLSAGTNCLATLSDLTSELIAADACGQVSVTQTPPVGTSLGIGNQVITFTVSDAAANTTNCAMLLTITPPTGVPPNVIISEFMADNRNTITDEDGNYSDWIEIHNAGCATVNLQGWFLTDRRNQLAKWRFPATNITSGQFMIVWASSRNRAIPGAPLHTNFRLAERGGYLALVMPGGTIATEFYPSFPPQSSDVSYGLPSNAANYTYLEWPTPEAPNSPAADAIPPVITWHLTNLVVAADTNCQTVMPDMTGANYIVAIDNSGSVTVTQSVAAGTLLTLGTNKVVLGVVDAVGNAAYCTNSVAVVDQTAPVIAWYVTNLVVAADTNCQGVLPDLTVTNYILAADNCGSVTVTQSIAGGTLLGLGTYEVMLGVVDARGNAAYFTNHVMVVDQTAPSITCPADINVPSEPGQSGAVVTYSVPVGQDNCSGAVTTQMEGLASGMVFPMGKTTNTFQVTDLAGNSSACSFVVTVGDGEPPVIIWYMTNVVVAVDTNCQGVLPDLTGTDYVLAVDNSSSVTVTQSVAAGMVLDLGTNEIVLGVVDAVGNAAYCTNYVLVVDQTAPSITCPADLNIPSEPGQSGAVVNYTSPVGQDNCSGAITTQVEGLASGMVFPAGKTTNTFQVTDAAGNSAACSFVVTVGDDEPPVILWYMTNVVVAADTNCQGVLPDLTGTNYILAVDNSGSVTVTQSVAVGTVLDLGMNEVVLGVVDAVGNTAYCTNFVAIMDQTAPVIVQYPTNHSLTIGSNCLVVLPDFAGEVVASEECSQVSVSQNPLPGTELGPGDHLITFTASDLASNASTAALLLTVTTPPSANTNLTISEFMAKNTVTITDEDGTYSDWIEIHNSGACPVNLDGWSLTDDFTQLAKWRFPATNIAGGQFLVIWASDKNRRLPGAPLHANFKLSDEGEYLALVQPDGTNIAAQFSPAFPPQLPDLSYGLPADTLSSNYLAWPTPGMANSPGTNFMVADLFFDPPRGWYTNSVSVAVGSPTAGVTIYYTTNGTVPGPTNGFVYAGPLLFTNTTVLRAAAYRPTYVPAFATHTYVFPDLMASQTGAGFPPTWGTNNYGDTDVLAIYSCNSNIVNDPRWSNQLPAALLSLPTVSVAMDTEDMFGTNGIYSHPFEDSDEWERPCSVEYFRPDSQPGFQINCGIQIQGGISRDPTVTPKHNLRLKFKQVYGASKLVFDLYPGSPVNEFDTLVLHASLNDHWFWIGPRAQMQRDQWCADTQREIGGYGTHGTFVHLYINGLYWGMYNLGERPDASYAARYLGGQKSDYDAFNVEELKDGTTNAWFELLAIVKAGVTNATTWSNVCYYLNVPHFIDYMLINFYAANEDWPWNNYWKDGAVTHGVPFHFLSWDAELTFMQVANNMTGVWLGDPGVVYASLRNYPEFRRLFGDHAQQLLFNGGALTPEPCVARWMKRAQEIDLGLISESARWGITNYWTPAGGFITHDDWLQEQNFLLTNWFPQRTDILIAQLRSAGIYPPLDAPVFSPHSGTITESLSVTITWPPGAILYCTTNGSDPRLPDGGISPEAQVYDQGSATTLVLTHDTELRARAFATNTWSALVQASYLGANEPYVRIQGVSCRSDGAVELAFVGWPGASYTLLAATNLSSASIVDPSGPGGSSEWEALATLVPFPDGTFSFVDTAATNYPARFYRVTSP